MERRAKERVKELFRARVWAVDAVGHPFSVDCPIDNMSETGLYLRLPSEMELGSEISLAVWIANGSKNYAIAGLRGLVLRNEPQPDKNYGIAVAIRHREIF